jgi:two-component system phosphate regulon sensor histidine kinase PhoR
MLVGWVSDDGPGVAASDQPRIFERFYKADRTRSGGGGTGLGLAIARHIVEGHGGVIRVESEEGRGATFMFTIPVSDAPAERQASTERSAVPARAAGG